MEISIKNIFNDGSFSVLIFFGVILILTPFFPRWGTMGTEDFIREISICFSISLLLFSIAGKLKNIKVTIKTLLPIYAIYLIRCIYILKDGWWADNYFYFISLAIFTLTNFLFLFFIWRTKTDSKNYTINILIAIIVIVALFFLIFLRETNERVAFKVYCGNAYGHEESFSSLIKINLCSLYNTDKIHGPIDKGSYSIWGCEDPLTGSITGCSTSKKSIDGKCGLINNKEMSNLNDSEKCDEGIFAFNNGSRWKCLGLNGGKNANCFYNH